MQGKKPNSSTGLRHIFAIVSSQISTMMEPSNAILEHEPTNRRYEISPRDIKDISFLSSLSIIHGILDPWYLPWYSCNWGSWLSFEVI